MPFKTQNPHLGPGGNIDSFAETEWPNGRIQLGYVFEKGVKRWQCFKVVDAVVAAAGDILYVKNYASYEATPTIGNSSRNEVAGVAGVATAAANTFVWLRQGGPMLVKAKAAPTAAFARGLQVFSDPANNEADAVAVAAAPLARPIGVALAAVATTAQGITGVAGKVVVDLKLLPL